ncbi:hypothetical protein [Companilactobacillus baiquanensis]|uniref:Uncharacterized protein n=1 Tax=Companilactobacillus baiquanensis TaxID=2486005 RepID=A0ABW1UUZ8_9LACO|nr:hypothetical protein [Companilactobacillus baiquanensis]
MEYEDLTTLKSALSGLYSTLDMSRKCDKMAAEKIRDTYLRLDDKDFLNDNTMSSLKAYLDQLSITEGLEFNQEASKYIQEIEDSLINLERSLGKIY